MLTVLKPHNIKIGDDVKDAVRRVLDEGLPFAMVARRPDGQWENSLSIGPNTYELIGALEALKASLLDDK